MIDLLAGSRFPRILVSFDSQLGIVDSDGILIARPTEPEKRIGRDVRDIEAMGCAVIARKEGSFLRVAAPQARTACGDSGRSQGPAGSPMPAFHPVGVGADPSTCDCGTAPVSVVLAVFGVAIWSIVPHGAPGTRHRRGRACAEGDDKPGGAGRHARDRRSGLDQFNRMIDVSRARRANASNCWSGFSCSSNSMRSCA